MLRLKAWDFVSVCFGVEQIQGDCLIDDLTATSAIEWEGWRLKVEGAMGFLGRHCESMGLDASAGQAGRIRAMVEHGLDRKEVNRVLYLARDLEKTLVRELKKPVFLQLEQRLASFYDEENRPHFGERVEKLFPKSTLDISEARRCFALERWDGCAYHMMLAIESAIRKWARDLRLRTRLPLELENLEQILQAAEVKLKEVKQRKKSRNRDADLKYLAETSGHFGFIKDAYRNHLAHGRERYDERKAGNLMIHVESFMRLLATRKTPIK